MLRHGRVVANPGQLARGADLDVLPGTPLGMVVAPMVAWSESRTPLHAVAGPVELGALHRAVSGHYLTGPVYLGHVLPPLRDDHRDGYQENLTKLVQYKPYTIFG